MKNKTKYTIIENNIKNVKKLIGGSGLAEIGSAGGNEILTHARININSTFSKYATGGAGLQESMTVEVARTTQNNALIWIYPAKIYGRIQELGGWIYPVYKKMLSWIDRDTKKRVFAKKVYIPARPYLRPAVDEHKPEIKQAMEITLARLLQKATR